MRVEKSVQKEAQMFLLQAQLARTKRRRILLAWQDRHCTLSLKRLLLARAMHLRRMQVLSTCIKAWRQLVRVRQRKAKQLEKAYEHRRQIVLKKGLRAWRMFVEHQQSKKALLAKALQHWSWARLRVCLLVWRARVDGWKQKKRELDGALQLHTERLIKRGVAHWLSVGTRLRQARLQVSDSPKYAGLMEGFKISTYRSMQAALEQQAWHTMASLKRAEPFARKWRFIVLQRRQQRRPWPYSLDIGGSEICLDNKRETSRYPFHEQPQTMNIASTSIPYAEAMKSLSKLTNAIKPLPSARPPARRPAILYDTNTPNIQRIPLPPPDIASHLTKLQQLSHTLAATSTQAPMLPKASDLSTQSAHYEFRPALGYEQRTVAHTAVEFATPQHFGQARPMTVQRLSAAGSQPFADAANTDPTVELASMEHALRAFEALKADLAECRAELQRVGVIGADPMRMQRLQQRAAALEESRKAQLPAIRDIALRIQQLRVQRL
eukprot:jgi/Chlat1/266/Chrsp1S00214